MTFCDIWDDQALEQENKKLKAEGQIIGLTQDEAGLNRLTTIAPVLNELLQDFLANDKSQG